MRKKSWVIVAGVVTIAALVYFASGGGEDRAIVDELARRQSASASAPPVSVDDDGNTPQPNMLRLTSSLSAERSDDRKVWVIRQAKSPSFIALPFVPPHDGIPSENSPREETSTGPRHDPGFRGAGACAECHQQKHAGFIKTAHHQTSGLVDAESALGHFAEPGNVLATKDPHLRFELVRRGGKCFQSVALADWKLQISHDVFTGSAKAGRTFLYWHNDALFQAHVSYLSKFDAWISSPGFDDTHVDYARPIRAGCLECHVTYIEQKQKPNLYHRDTAVWGISCERCHGPGADHIAYHRENPEEKSARHIVHPAELPRQRQLQICGQCHSGSFSLLGEPFSYRPGDDLDKHHKLRNPDPKGVGGIHTSNQLTRLSMSNCFRESEMTCTSCHDPHQNQRAARDVFTTSCLKCHQRESCGMSDQLGESITDGCIDCHMPMGDNEGMTLRVDGGSFTVTMIDHWIRIDEKATELYLK